MCIKITKHQVRNYLCTEMIYFIVRPQYGHNNYGDIESSMYQFKKKNYN